MPDGRSLAAPAAGLLIAATALAALAIAQPHALAALSVVALGPLHVLLALRYLTGRTLPILDGPIGRTLLALVAAMVLIRAITVASPHLGHHLELLGGAALVGFAAWVGLRGTLRYVALGVVAAVTALSFVELPWYWHFLTHGHNVVPLIFLWDWTRRFRPIARLGFVAANLLWVAAIPLLLLFGPLGGHVNPDPPAVVGRIADPAFLVAAASPPGADASMGLRFLAVFAFLQAMHYVLWMLFFQVAGRREVDRLGRSVPAAVGWRFWLIAALTSLAIWATYAIGYNDGRAVYGVLGALNVALEQPIAVWLLLGALPSRLTTAPIATLKAS